MNPIETRMVGRKLLPVLTAVLWGMAMDMYGQIPAAFTQTAAPVRATNAVLNGMALPKGNATIAWFEWGLDRNYGNSTEAIAIGNGQSVVRVSSPLGDLIEGGVYHFRLIASNAFGIKRGYDQQFTTGMKIQNWGGYSFGSPAVPTGLTNIVAVAAGREHCLALRNDGTVTVYAIPSYINRGQTNMPTGLSNVVAVAGGFSHSLALKEDGTVVAWGKYENGYGDIKIVTVPAGLSNVIAIGGGDFHSLALKADGTLVCWSSSPSYPSIPYGLKDVVAISCGSAHNLALKVDGTISVWGAVGNLPPSSATNVVAIATESTYNLALRADGTVVDWGSVSSEIPKPALTNIAAIAAGYQYGEALKTDGTLVAWGRAREVTNVPPLLTNVVAIASGDRHCLGLAPVNLPPRCVPRKTQGGVNRDLTIPLSVFEPNGDLCTVRVSTLPAQGQLYQYSNGLRGDPIVTPGTVINSSRVIFVPEPDTLGVPYTTFSFSADDGAMESLPALVTVTIVPHTFIASYRIVAAQTNGFALSFSGLQGGTYSVWRSPQLPTPTWVYVGAAAETAPGQFHFTDYSISNLPVSFYRVAFP